MSNTNNHEFTIRFEDIELSAEAKERIQQGIDSLVLHELAGHKPQNTSKKDYGDVTQKLPSHNLIGVLIPHDWNGIFIKNMLIKGGDLNSVLQRGMTLKYAIAEKA